MAVVVDMVCEKCSCRTIVWRSALCPVIEDGKNIYLFHEDFVDGVRMAGGLPMVIPLGDKSLVEIM